MTTWKVKKAVTPIPGASAKGRLATSPIRMLEKAETRMVAVRAPEKRRPPVDRMLGLTIIT